MAIDIFSRLDPFSYKTKTQKGNEYRATYNSAVVLGACSAAMSAMPIVTPYFVTNPKEKAELKNYSFKKSITSAFEEVFKKKISPNKVLALYAVGSVIALAVSVAMGISVDDGVNQRRAKLADKNADKKAEKAKLDKEA